MSGTRASLRTDRHPRAEPRRAHHRRRPSRRSSTSSARTAAPSRTSRCGAAVASPTRSRSTPRASTPSSTSNCEPATVKEMDRQLGAQRVDPAHQGAAPRPRLRRASWQGRRCLMAGDTVITVVGNLTADPELRFTPSGAAVANFTVASTPRTFDRQTGEWKDGEALFLRCNIWRQAAENVAETLTRGMRVIVQGRLRQRSFETREGEKRTVIELEVDEVGPSLRYATASRSTRPPGVPGAAVTAAGAATVAAATAAVAPAGAPAPVGARRRRATAGATTRGPPLRPPGPPAAAAVAATTTSPRSDLGSRPHRPVRIGPPGAPRRGGPPRLEVKESWRSRRSASRRRRSAPSARTRTS